MAQFTQKAILSTFQNMLEEMPFDKITVSAIVKRCEISSNTFYYHFRDIYDLLDKWFISISYVFSDKPELSWSDTAKNFLHVCKNNKRIVYSLCRSFSREQMAQYIFAQSNDYIVRYIRDIAGDKKLSDDFVNQIEEFCRYSTIGFFFRFLWNQMNDDIDNSVDCLSDMLYDFIDSVVEKHQSKADT